MKRKKKGRSINHTENHTGYANIQNINIQRGCIYVSINRPRLQKSIKRVRQRVVIGGSLFVLGRKVFIRHFRGALSTPLCLPQQTKWPNLVLPVPPMHAAHRVAIRSVRYKYFTENSILNMQRYSCYF